MLQNRQTEGAQFGVALTFSDLSIRESESPAALDLTLPWVTRAVEGRKPAPYLGTNNLFLLACRELAAASPGWGGSGRLLVGLARALGLSREQADFFWTWARQETPRVPGRPFASGHLYAKAHQLALLDGVIEDREKKLLAILAGLLKVPAPSARQVPPAPPVAESILLEVPAEVDTSRPSTAPWEKVVASIAGAVTPAAPPAPQVAAPIHPVPRARPLRAAPAAEALPTPAPTRPPVVQSSRALALASAATHRGRAVVLALIASLGLAGLVQSAWASANTASPSVEDMF